MARYFKTIILLAVLLLTACQEGREAGNLLGQWRMTGSDTNYISFSGSVVLLRCTAVSEGMVYGNFQHKGDSLFMQFYSAKGLARDTTVVEKEFGFVPFNNTRLKITALDNDQLLLSKDGKTWSFYKY